MNNAIAKYVSVGRVVGRLYGRIGPTKLGLVQAALDEAGQEREARAPELVASVIDDLKHTLNDAEMQMLIEALNEAYGSNSNDDDRSTQELTGAVDQRYRQAQDAAFPDMNRLKTSGMGAAVPLRKPFRPMTSTQSEDYAKRFPNEGRLK